LSPKLVIVTEIIAPYRIPVFNDLAKRREVDLHVIFLAENDPSLRRWRVYKEEIEFQYDVLPFWRRRLGRFNVLINRGIIAALDRIRPDALVCGGYNYVASWQAAYWARARRVPFLLWTESTALDKRGRHLPIEFLKNRFRRLCRGFVVPGSASSGYLMDLGVPQERIFTAPNAIDIARFSRLAEESRSDELQIRSELSLPSRYFLYVGRIVRAKGVFELLEAYAQMETDIRGKIGLVVVGDGADRIELMRRAARIRPGNIVFPGFVHRDELVRFYTLGEALLLPTHSDTWGLVVNEAMSCGLPVIVTSVAGCTADLVQNGWNGVVVSPKDPPQLANAMTRLANDSGLSREMGIRSWQRIQAYSPTAWSEGMVKAATGVYRTD
jgi:glycosyltransferase involved in cell wall biosynthesis